MHIFVVISAWGVKYGSLKLKLTLYPSAFPSLWCFASRQQWRHHHKPLSSELPFCCQSISHLFLYPKLSCHPADSGHQQHSSHYQSTQCLCGIPALSLSPLSNTHIHSIFFFLSLKSIESPRKYWQLEATTGWSDSRKPLIMITSSYFSFSFPPFFLSPVLDLLPPWPGHDLLTNMSMSYLPQRRAADHSITSFLFLMPQNIHCCLFSTIVWYLFTLTTNHQNWWSMEEQEVVSWHVHHRLHLQRACKLT